MAAPERETPLTDAAQVLVPMWTADQGDIDCYMTESDFARRLERVAAELAEALRESESGWDASLEKYGERVKRRKSALTNYAELQKEMKR